MSLELFGLEKIWLNTFFSLRYEKMCLIIYQQCVATQTQLRNNWTWILIGYAFSSKTWGDQTSAVAVSIETASQTQ
jgi:hypothetical protein